MNGPHMYVTHEHEVLEHHNKGSIVGSECHSHSIHYGHPGNWTNREHEGIAIISWAEHGRRYRQPTPETIERATWDRAIGIVESTTTSSRAIEAALRAVVTALRIARDQPATRR